MGLQTAMTPEERANKVRSSYEDAARRHPHDGNIDTLLPPGSIILAPDEARSARVPLILHPEAWRGQWIHLRDKALALLGGAA